MRFFRKWSMFRRSIPLNSILMNGIWTTIKLRRIQKTAKLNGKLVFPEVHSMLRSQNFFYGLCFREALRWTCWNPQLWFSSSCHKKNSLVFYLSLIFLQNCRNYLSWKKTCLHEHKLFFPLSGLGDFVFMKNWINSFLVLLAYF